MPRRHPERQAHVPLPLDLTPTPIPERHYPRPKPLTPGERREHPIDRRERERNDRAEQQRLARIKGGIDWRFCLVPGCGAELISYGRYWNGKPERRDAELRLPMCHEHALLVWQEVQRIKREPLIIETNDMLVERAREKQQAAHEAAKQRKLRDKSGHIYFVRLNGLVKAGWSREVGERLRAYGPDVEVLCVYPGSRDDETNLHRQLRPVLARGREWYHDCQIIADFVAAAIEKHGPPTIHDSWTRPKEVIRIRRR